MKKKLLIYMVLFSMVTGCSFSPEPQYEEPEVFQANDNLRLQPLAEEVKESNPVYGGALNISMRTPVTMNPLINTDTTVGDVLKLLFEDIFVLNDEGIPMPNLADSIIFEEDGLSATVHLKEHIYWSDGTKITSDDFVYSFKTLTNADAEALYKDIIKDILSVSKIDASTVKLSFSRPSGGLGYMLLFPLIPMHYYSKISDDSPKDLIPLGNGAYKYQDSETINSMSFSVNDMYFKDSPYIEKVNIMMTSDTQTDYYAFEQNLTNIISADILDFGKYSPSRKTELTEFDTNYYDFIGFNFKNILFEDKKIRQAIAHLIDNEYIIQSIYLNHAYTATSVVIPSSWAYEPEVENYRYDVEMANNLIRQAGFEDKNNDGIVERDMAGMNFNFSVRLLVNEENKERVGIAKLLKKSLEEAGIGVELISCDFETYCQKLLANEFDIFVGGFNLSLKPDFNFAFHSAQIKSGGNYFNYASEELDGYLSAAQNAVTQEAYKKELSNIQKYIASELPCISIAFRKKTLLYSENIKGEKSPAINNIYSNINQWYISPDE